MVTWMEDTVGWPFPLHTGIDFCAVKDYDTLNGEWC